MKSFKFKDHEFQISLDGILFWIEKKIAIISDLHLEKGSSYASTGQLIPPYDSFETLNNFNSRKSHLFPANIFSYPNLYCLIISNIFLIML